MNSLSQRCKIEEVTKQLVFRAIKARNTWHIFIVFNCITSVEVLAAPVRCCLCVHRSLDLS